MLSIIYTKMKSYSIIYTIKIYNESINVNKIFDNIKCNLNKNEVKDETRRNKGSRQRNW